MALKLNRPKGNSPASPTKFNPTGFGVLVEDLLSYPSRDENGFDVIGEPCLPMQLVPSQTNSSDGKFFTLTWQAYGATDKLNAFYEGEIIRGKIPKSTGKSITINGSVSKVVQVASADTTATLTFALSNLKNNDLVTLIGSGGVAPFTLESAVAGSATVILFNGTQWTALENASITLRYVDAGATKYLVEVARG